MKVLVVGPGAVGLGIANALIGSGHEVTLGGRGESVARLAAGPIIRTGVLGSFIAAPGSFRILDLSALENDGGGGNATFDHILICTKADSVDEACKSLKPSGIGMPNSVVTLFVNGWGSAETVSRYFHKSRVFSVRILTGFERVAPHHVNISVHGKELLIGNIFTHAVEEAIPLAMALTVGGLPARAEPDIAAALWEKLAYNCAVNAPGALWNGPARLLLDDDNGRELMTGVIQETFRVMEAAGYRTSFSGSEAYTRAFFDTMLPMTAGHVSSLLQDLRSGRKTEVTYLNGAVVKLAGEWGLPAPLNALLTCAIRRLEVS